ncbi:4-(cytidine 5'-diphospho)-2-C-methyl-D-erythritol kinase [Corynebacterium sp. 13CS0277]|uniref:4-(cytidine 5'-diphospho)-2-C-methyl-D-erythritol kinase n=1 Tax=Corynebacterium sp. 13CS0277 TaxID=2071994 RepID=UPI000D03A36A|nr:4-(cytidine 5'-diphospho)-2-C-methyl-D-erythritol kinase [Corynebacterium sp. 13CS0277]PRQ12466.1 4-(cytidine 5'-diphospho)-2-C-methyl-D-erythritol kinase [Corynebacterium sp. 13CS0277]
MSTRPTPGDQARLHPRPFHMVGRARGGVTEIARSKVNLHLGVGDARPDGYHELVTVFQSLSLHDQVTITPTPEADGPVSALSVQGPSSHVIPVDGSNLAWQAVEVFAGAAGVPVPPVAVHITKGIPVAGGMAGGSADAAAVLRSMNTLCGAPLTRAQLLDLAAQLGSDVPFCLLEGHALARGRGELLQPLPTRPRLHFALAFHRRGLSTPKVFAQLDDMRAAGTAPAAGPPDALLAAGSPEEVAPLIANDLQAPALALAPHLAATLAVGEEAGALRGFVSGSGPTCAFLCADEAAARRVAHRLHLEKVADDTACAHTVGAAEF